MTGAPSLAGQPRLTLVLLLLGDYARVERPLARTLISLRRLGQGTNLVVVADGPSWATTPLVQQFAQDVSHSFTTSETIEDHPGRLANLGWERVGTEFAALIWPGTTYDPDIFATLTDVLSGRPDAALVFSRVKASMTDAFVADPKQIHYGHLQLADLVSLSGAILRTDAVHAIGGFDPDPILQRVPGWELAIRLARRLSLAHVELPALSLDLPPPDWDWEEYPFLRTRPVSLDAIHRAIVHADRLDQRPSSPRRANAWARTSKRTEPGPLEPPLRVTVLTAGPWEPVHNQLCFFNYFECPEGRPRFHWKAVLDDSATEDDLENCDLVVVSRGRGPRVPHLIDYCERRGIPSLYMLDDNWFTVADDWPEYRELFGPDQPCRRVLVDALRRCTATVVYSPVLEGYVRPHARRTIRLDVNVCLEQFRPVEPPPFGRPFLVGFAGSPRYTDAAFIGMSKFLASHPESRALFFGVALPDCLSDLHSAGRLHFEPYTSYLLYARRIAELAPDVLVSPLPANETTRSKCFNKYLEITACGAVGVYSGLEPYTQVVRDGDNGVLVPSTRNEEPEAWLEALETLHRDPSLRVRLLESARREVAARYETSRRFADFHEVVRQLAAS